jgi:hypothetical protein
VLVAGSLAACVLACGAGRPAPSGHGDDDELPEPMAPTDLPDDPGKPFEEGDRPLVDPAREMAPSPSASTRPKR